MSQKTTNRPPKQSRLREILTAIAHSLGDHLGFKVLALALAVLLWSGLITQDPTLTREKTFTDVNISISGSDAIKRNGMIVVSDLSDQLSDAVLRVNVPQMQYTNAQATFYNARIDLSRVTEVGEQDVRVATTNSSTYGSVSEITPNTVHIDVERYVTRYRIPVSVNTVGELPEGYRALSVTADPPIVAVSGPESLVEKIARAEVTLDLHTAPAREGTVRMAVPFALLEADGTPVESSLLEVTSESVLLDSVVVELQLYAERSISLSDVGLIKGEVPDGYEIKSIGVTPEVITAAGRGDSLELLDTLFVDNAVDVSGQTETFSTKLRIRRPSEISYLSTDTVTVVVEIGPVIKERTFQNIRLEVRDIAKGMEASLGTKMASVTITGPQLWVDKLRGGDVSLFCSASGLGAGEYDQPVVCSVNGSDGIAYEAVAQPETVVLTIHEK